MAAKPINLALAQETLSLARLVALPDHDYRPMWELWHGRSKDLCTMWIGRRKNELVIGLADPANPPPPRVGSPEGTPQHLEVATNHPSFTWWKDRTFLHQVQDWAKDSGGVLQLTGAREELENLSTSIYHGVKKDPVEHGKLMHLLGDVFKGVVVPPTPKAFDPFEL